MNSVLDEILRTGMVRSPGGELLDAYPVSIPEEKGEFLQKLIRSLQPTTCLEVGLAYGVSTLFICDALCGTANWRHIVIDPDQRESWKDIGLHNLRSAGYESMIEFYEMPAHRALPQLDAQGRQIDFAFIDGWHTFDYTLVDFFFIDKLLKVGGLVVLDDTDWPSIRKLCRYITTNRAYTPLCMSDAPVTERSLKRRLVSLALRTPCISRTLPSMLQPELIETDVQLGLWGECIAFKKESEDTRLWDFHLPF